MANSADPDEMARYEPSHLDLHCLHRHLDWSARLKRLNDYFYGRQFFFFNFAVSKGLCGGDLLLRSYFLRTNEQCQTETK